MLRRARRRPRAGRQRRRVLIVDRYEIGERQTSACAAPTDWLENLGLTTPSSRRSASSSCTAGAHAALAAAVDLLHLRLPAALRACCASSATARRFETAKVEGRTGDTVHTDRGDLRAPLIVDALGWRRVLSAGDTVQPPDARLSRGLEVHPDGRRRRPRAVARPEVRPRGYSWSFPADDEVRVGVGSFDPRDHVKQPTLQLAQDLGVPAERWQGNWIPHELRPATEDGIFFVGDSAGHCLPTTAEGIRTAFYFGLASGASCATSSRAARRASRRWSATARSPTTTCGSSAGCCASRTGSAGSRRARAADAGASAADRRRRPASCAGAFGRYRDICAAPETSPPPSARRARSAPAQRRDRSATRRRGADVGRSAGRRRTRQERDLSRPIAQHADDRRHRLVGRRGSQPPERVRGRCPAARRRLSSVPTRPKPPVRWRSWTRAAAAPRHLASIQVGPPPTSTPAAGRAPRTRDHLARGRARARRRSRPPGPRRAARRGSVRIGRAGRVAQRARRRAPSRAS